MAFGFTDGPEIGKETKILKGLMGARKILEPENGKDYLESVRQGRWKSHKPQPGLLKLLTSPLIQFFSWQWTEYSHTSSTSRPPAA